MISEEREHRIIENIGLVHSIANRFRNRGYDYEDLFQSGCIGLIKAVDNYDESRNTMFSTYAVPVIMGEIKRLFREGGAVKVSRLLKEKATFVQLKKDEFEVKNMREPTLNELSELCNIEPYELNEILNINNPVLSLSKFYEDDDELEIPDNNEAEFNRILLSSLMSELKNNDRKII